VVLLLSLLWFAIVSFLIVRALNQRGLVVGVEQVPPPPSAEAPRLAVIIPARNEEANIRSCLEAVLAQDYPASCLSVFVVDDHSADATASIVRNLAARDNRLELIHSPPLPPRWIGKSHACWIAARAVAPEIDWLCFIDADVKIEPACLASAVHAATAQGLDLLSLVPRHELHSFAERLMLPCGLILLSFVQDLRQAQAPLSKSVTVTGQFMLVRHASYEAVGGHAAVYSAICEDWEFARRVKQSGRNVLLMSGEKLVSTRMYTGWQTLWPGLAKNLVDTLRGPTTTLTLAVAAVVLAWAAVAIPLIDAAAMARGVPFALPALILSVLASAAAFGLHVAAAFYFRVPFWYGLIFPLGYTAGAAMAFDSVHRRLSGRVSWKGRIYS
jgi:chlorobactene glucosyltransferase